MGSGFGFGTRGTGTGDTGGAGAGTVALMTGTGGSMSMVPSDEIPTCTSSILIPRVDDEVEGIIGPAAAASVAGAGAGRRKTM